MFIAFSFACAFWGFYEIDNINPYIKTLARFSFVFGFIWTLIQVINYAIVAFHIFTGV